MLKSMTAFGRAKREYDDRDVTVEIKSVNGRYFDCSIKLPRAYLQHEDKLRTHIQKSGVARGKVDVFVTVEMKNGAAAVPEIDFEYANGYVSVLRSLCEKLGVKDDISAMTVAQNRDIFVTKKEEDDEEREWLRLREVASEALDGFFAMRAAEGEKTAADMTAKLSRISELSEKVAEISKSDIVGYRAKLEGRIKQILGENNVVIDEQRILTECAIFADRLAIDEELERLASHLVAFAEILGQPEPAGRKLDFLTQEINREINTMGSKANNAEIARLVVDMKSEVEKIREQVQNVE